MSKKLSLLLVNNIRIVKSHVQFPQTVSFPCHSLVSHYYIIYLDTENQRSKATKCFFVQIFDQLFFATKFQTNYILLIVFYSTEFESTEELISIKCSTKTLFNSISVVCIISNLMFSQVIYNLRPSCKSCLTEI